MKRFASCRQWWSPPMSRRPQAATHKPPPTGWMAGTEPHNSLRISFTTVTNEADRDFSASKQIESLWCAAALRRSQKDVRVGTLARTSDWFLWFPPLPDPRHPAVRFLTTKRLLVLNPILPAGSLFEPVRRCKCWSSIWIFFVFEVEDSCPCLTLLFGMKVQFAVDALWEINDVEI